MMVLINNIYISSIIKSSRLLYLLLFLVFIFFSCEKKIRKDDSLISIKKDSIQLKIDLPGKTTVELNYRNRYIDNVNLVFTNKTKDTLTVSKKIVKAFLNTIITYSVLVYDNGKLKPKEQVFVIDEKSDILNLLYDSEKYLFKNTANSINELHLEYKIFQKEYFKEKSKKKYIKELELLHLKLSKGNNKLFSNINDLYFLNLLEIISPQNEKVDYFLNNNISIASKHLGMLLFNYTKNRILQFDYKILDKKNKYYRDNLALGHFLFLKFEDNKGDIKYKKAINWLKTTDFYKKDSVFIKKKITPLNNYNFKQKIKNINLINIFEKEETISNIINKNPSNFYLLDFWATWCAPCIDGIKKIEKMEIPKNIKVISISLDKEKDKEKWKLKTKKLKQELTYWLNEENTKTKAFLKFIELQSIPRYILIDKNLNLIDQAFYHPSESQFLKKLKEIKNHKYW